MMLAQIIRIGKKKALTQTISTLIKQMINGQKPEITHPLMIGIGKNQRDPITTVPAMGYRTSFAAEALAIFID